MEPMIPFDLNRALRQWRGSLAASPAVRWENLDELESHLRDSITRLQTGGLSIEEAFLIATRRAGSPTALAAEFHKINTSSIWLDRVLWMLIGIQVWGITTAAVKTLASTLMAWAWGSWHPQLQPTDYSQQPLALPVTLFVLAQLFALAVSVGFCWWFFRQWPVWSHRAGKLLSHRFAFLAASVGLAIFALLVQGLSNGIYLVLPRMLSPAVYGATAFYATYSTLVVWPLQIIIMVGLTVMLARRRFLLGHVT